MVYSFWVRPPPYATLLAAFLVLFSTAGCDLGGGVFQPDTSSTCATLPCQSGVSLHAALSISSAEVIELEVEVCRNEVCARRQPTPQESGADFDCATSGPLSTTCALTQGSTAADFELAIFFAGHPEDFQDGDHYIVRVGKPGAPPLFSTDKQVRYKGCLPLCRTAEL